MDSQSQQQMEALLGMLPLSVGLVGHATPAKPASMKVPMRSTVDGCSAAGMQVSVLPTRSAPCTVLAVPVAIGHWLAMASNVWVPKPLPFSRRARMSMGSFQLLGTCWILLTRRRPFGYTASRRGPVGRQLGCLGSTGVAVTWCIRYEEDISQTARLIDLGWSAGGRMLQHGIARLDAMCLCAHRREGKAQGHGCV